MRSSGGTAGGRHGGAARALRRPFIAGERDENLLRGLARGRLGTILQGLVVGLLAGTLAKQVDGSVLVGAAMAVAWLALVAARPGVGIGVWALAAVNGLPFLNMDRFRVPGAFRPEDMLLGLLLLAAALTLAGRPQQARISRPLLLATVSLGAVWIVTLAQSVLLANIPLLKAALFGRDFLFYPLTAVAALSLLGRRPRAWTEALLVVTAGAVVFAAGQLVYQLLGIQLSFIVHPYQESVSSGVVRPYQWTHALVWLLVLPSLSAAIGSVGRARWLWLGATGMVLSSVYFAQTRAVVFGLVVGGVCLLVLLARTRILTRRLGAIYALALVLTVAALAAVMLSPSVREAGGAVFERYSTLGRAAIGAAEAPDTFSYRREIAGDMLRVLGNDWPWGLGFLHPEVHQVPSLPKGTIRNNDLGMMQALMTMGVIGVVCVIGVVLAVVWPPLMWLWRDGPGAGQPAASRAVVAIASGLVATLAAGLAVGLTLGIYIDAPSAMAAGALSGVLMALLDEHRRASLRAEGSTG